MPLKIITTPDSEPVTLSEAKMHLRETLPDNDTLINSLITAARQWAENFTGRALLTQTWDYLLDAFTDEAIVLPFPPLQSVTSIKYIDASGVEQTLATSEYVVDTASQPGVVRLAYGKSWPSARAQANAVAIRFAAGYGNASAVPGAIKSACLLMIGELYERREHGIAGTVISVVPVSAEYLLFPYRIWTV